MNKGNAFDPLQDAKKQENAKDTSLENKSVKKDEKPEKKDESDYEYDEEFDDAETVKSVKQEEGITSSKDLKNQEINKLYDKYVNKDDKKEDKKEDKKDDKKIEEKKEEKKIEEKKEEKKKEEKKDDKPEEKKFSLADFRKQQDTNTNQKTDTDSKEETFAPQESKVIVPVKLEESKLDQKPVADQAVSLKKEDSKSKITENKTEPVKIPEIQQISEKKVEQAKLETQKDVTSPTKVEVVQQNKEVPKPAEIQEQKKEEKKDEKKEEKPVIISPEKNAATSSATDLTKNAEKQTSTTQDAKLIKPVEIKPEEKKVDQRPQNVADSATSLKKEDSTNKITEIKTEPDKKPEAQQITEKKVEQAKPDPQKDVTIPTKVEQPKEVKKEEKPIIEIPQKTNSTTDLTKNTEKQTSAIQDPKVIKPVEIKPEEKKVEQKPQNVADSATSLKKEDSKSKITENKTEPVKQSEVQQITEVEQAKPDPQKEVTSPTKLDQTKEIPKPPDATDPNDKPEVKKEENALPPKAPTEQKAKDPVADIPQDSSKPQSILPESPSKILKKVSFHETKPEAKAAEKPVENKVLQDQSAPVQPKKDFSLNSATQDKRLQKWVENMRKFKLFNGDRLPPPKHSESYFYGLQISELSPSLVLPKEYMSEDKFCFTVSISITLCNPIVGLFGRTAAIKVGDSQGKPCKIGDIKVDNWVFMHSDLDMQETFAICEVVCNIYKKDKEAEYLLINNFSVGVLPVRLFQPVVDKKTSPRPSGTQKISLYMTSPRNFMAFSEKNKTVESKLEGIKFPAPGYKLTANFLLLKVDQSIQTQILKLIPANCLVSPQDNLPGFIKESIGQNFKTEILQELKFEKLTQCWAHQIKVDNLESIETMFQKYLKTQVEDSGYKTEIISRKISCTPSNSCFLGSAFQASTDITLKDDKSKKPIIKLSIPTAPLKITNLATSPLTCLVFRISYKVKYTLSGQSDTLREFVLGRQPFFPNFDFTYGSGFIKDRNVELELNMCPELFIINDLLWDVNEQNLSPNEIFLKLKFIMSNSEDLKSEQESQQLEQKFIETEMLQKQKTDFAQVQEKGKPSGAQQTSVDEAVLRRMAQLQIQNTFLQEQVSQIEKVKKDQYQKKATSVSKKEEILKPINEGDRSIPVDDDAHKGLLDVLLNRQDTDIKSLLNLLQRLISKTQEDKDQYKGVVSRLSGTILRLLESDQLAQMTVFGTKSGRLKAIQFNNLTEDDKISIIENSARGDGKPLSDMSVLDFGKLQVKPNLKLEIDDQFKASTISFQFVAIKTPQWLAHPINLPQRVFFTFKFYMFRQTTSEHLLLRLPKAAVETIKHQQALQKIQNSNEGQKTSSLILGKQYFLMKQDLAAKAEVKIDDKQPKLSKNSLELVFDFDPAQIIAGQEKELEHNHELFCKYLNERVLTVEVWNADSLMHFGTFKIPLFLIMRQGDPSKVVGQEFDIVEADYAEKVGSIQMVITNSGRQLTVNKDKSQSPQKKQDRSLSPQKIQKNTVMISSKPMQTFEIQETMQEKLDSAKQKANQLSKLAMSEEDRKRLRVERIKQAALKSGTKLTSIQSLDSNEWAKKEELKQIKLMREQNKQKLINMVASQAIQMNQSTLDVVSGTPNFIELEVNNPYEKSQNFKVQIIDTDFDAGIIEKPEMILVQIDEWQHWASEGKCELPQKNLGLLGDMLELDVGERCKLLFKFLSFREPVVEASSKDEKSIEQQMKRKVQELTPRKIHLEIVDSQGMSVQSLTINICPQEMIFDHFFRFYEAEGTTSQSLIPNFVRHLAPGQASSVDEDSGLLLKQCKIMCSDKQVKLEIVSNDCLQATIKNEKSRSSKKAFVFIYGDQYCSKLLASCVIEFNALTQLQIKVKAGIEYDHMLEIAGSEAERTVEVYSSDPQLIYPPSGKSQNIFELKKGKKNEVQTIPICLRAHSFGTHRARLNLIDLNTRELVSCFLVVIEAEKPIVDQAVVVSCQKGQKEFVKYAFKNPFSNEKVQFSVTTTDMKLLKPNNEIEELQPKEEKDICLIVQESADIGTHEVLMHLNRVNQDQDHHEMHTQTVLFNIQIHE